MIAMKSAGPIEPNLSAHICPNDSMNFEQAKAAESSEGVLEWSPVHGRVMDGRS